MRWFLLLVIVLGLGGCVGGQRLTDIEITPPLRILAVSDTHLRAGVDSDPQAPGARYWNQLHYASHANLRYLRDLCIDQRDSIDLLVHLGDICDVPPDWGFFTSVWADIPVKKAIAVGNHDFDVLSYTELADVLDYAERPVLGGSVFNETFTLTNGAICAQVFVLNTNYDTSGKPSNPVTGRFSPETLAWIEQELYATKCSFILFFSHHGPHHYAVPSWLFSLFDRSSSQAFQAVIERVLAERPDLQFYYFYGHWHGNELGFSNALGSAVPGYRIPDSVGQEPGQLVEIYLSHEGLWFDTVELQYPYP